MESARARQAELELIERARAGDEIAYAELVERYQVAVYNLCYRMLGQGQDAEDAAQEVFLRAHRQLHTYKPAHRFSTWLLSIASHYCIDQLRKRRLTLTQLDSIIPWARSREPGPDDLAAESEQRDHIQRLLRRLPEKYRLALVLRYWHDLSYAEMATAAGLPENTIKTRLHRARQMMAKVMTEAEAQRDVVSEAV